MTKYDNKQWLFVLIAMTLVSLISPISASAETVHLEWNAPANGGQAEGYYLYYGLSQDIAQMTKIQTPIYDTQYTMELSTQGKTYYFRVVAFNSAGEGPASTARVVNIHLTVVQ